ncbi:MAG: hypothetical protein LBT05_02555 [Planctomycetaceae bacterium]|jgi:hypothetical protein|nr:hypothetical protein [Planctomycetaceae bacterium]
MFAIPRLKEIRVLSQSMLLPSKCFGAFLRRRYYPLMPRKYSKLNPVTITVTDAGKPVEYVLVSLVNK